MPFIKLLVEQHSIATTTASIRFHIVPIRNNMMISSHFVIGFPFNFIFLDFFFLSFLDMCVFVFSYSQLSVCVSFVYIIMPNRLHFEFIPVSVSLQYMRNLLIAMDELTDTYILLLD